MGNKSEIKALKKKLRKLEAKEAEKKARKSNVSRLEPDLDHSQASTAISTQTRPTSAISSLMPRNLDELERFAVMMSEGGPAIGSSFRNEPGACGAITLQAIRWGMDPFALSQEAYVVRDTVGYSGKMIAGIIQSHPSIKGRLRYEYTGDAALKTRACIVTGYFVGDDEPYVLETPQMKKIDKGGKGSPLWQNDPDQQLAYYGARNWARRFAPGIMSGLISADEAEHAHELNEPKKSNTQKRLEAMEEKKAAAKAKAEPEEEIIEAEIVEEDMGDERPVEPRDDTPPEPELEPEPDALVIDLPDEAHDWFEALHGFESAKELEAAYEAQSQQKWVEGLSEAQAEEVSRMTQEKLNELRGT